MKQTKKPVTGGILTILCGIFGLLGTYWYAIGFGEPGSGIGRGDMPPFVPSIIFGLPVPAAIIAVVAIAGGILAVTRKHWRWSLAGSIAGVLSFIILGIPAIFLVYLARDEFK
jgi:hypothetical protein